MVEQGEPPGEQGTGWEQRTLGLAQRPLFRDAVFADVDASSDRLERIERKLVPVGVQVVVVAACAACVALSSGILFLADSTSNVTSDTGAQAYALVRRLREVVPAANTLAFVSLVLSPIVAYLVLLLNVQALDASPDNLYPGGALMPPRSDELADLDAQRPRGPRSR